MKNTNTTPNKLKSILKEDFEQQLAKKSSPLEFNINQKSLINNIINKFDMQQYKNILLEQKKKFEGSFAHALFEYMKNNVGVAVTEDDVKDVLYNMDVICSFTLFKDINIEFDNTAFVDELQNTIQNKPV